MRETELQRCKRHLRGEAPAPECGHHGISELDLVGATDSDAAEAAAADETAARSLAKDEEPVAVALLMVEIAAQKAPCLVVRALPDERRHDALVAMHAAQFV